MYKVFLKYPESLRPAFPRLKEKLEDPDPGIRKQYLSSLLGNVCFSFPLMKKRDHLLVFLVHLICAPCPQTFCFHWALIDTAGTFGASVYMNRAPHDIFFG